MCNETNNYYLFLRNVTHTMCGYYLAGQTDSCYLRIEHYPYDSWIINRMQQYRQLTGEPAYQFVLQFVNQPVNISSNVTLNQTIYTTVNSTTYQIINTTVNVTNATTGKNTSTIVPRNVTVITEHNVSSIVYYNVTVWNMVYLSPLINYTSSPRSFCYHNALYFQAENLTTCSNY